MKNCFQYLVVAAMLFAAAPSLGQEHHHDATEDLGSVSFPVSCAPAILGQFTRGMALLYSFEYEQSQQAFEKVAAADPQCAMAYWGQGMSLYHQLWDRPSKPNLKRGAELLAKARERQATPRERDYIQALTVFYTDTDRFDHNQRAQAYAKAMEGVYQRYPQDREAAVLYALSLLASSPERDPDLSNEKAAVAILNKLFREEPTHPGIAHYIIHSCDNPAMASLALPAARKYASIAPASAHAVHMPSHIFARLGLWQEDIHSNVVAIEIADKMADMHFHVLHHKLHSMDFLEYAYLQIGDDANAKREVDAIAAIPKSQVDPDFGDYFEVHQALFPATDAIERRQWKDVVGLQPNPQAVPYAQMITYWARALGAGHLHDAAAAEDALKHYEELLEATRKGSKPYIVDSLKEQQKEVQAWADFASGKPDDALKLLRSVADEQDKIGKGETELPAREMLADMLLELNRPQEALAEFEVSLHTDPNRFNGLYGAAQAASQTQQKEKATAYFAQLLKNCDGSNSARPELREARTLLAAR
jgi:hypothetical protein